MSLKREIEFVLNGVRTRASVPVTMSELVRVSATTCPKAAVAEPNRAACWNR